MSSTSITKDTFKFLKELEANNNRDWFAEHKVTFKKHEAGVKTFLGEVLSLLEQHDDIEKLKMFRIYRDVRFSKNKAPYKTNLAGSFARQGVRLRGGYYVHIQPGASFIATGFWAPNKEDLLRIRKEFEIDATEFRTVLADKNLKKHWGELQGDELKTAPKNFNKEHENIDLIKKKQFIFVKNFTDAEVLSENFAQEIDAAFKAIRPYFDLMSSILTTNTNGESLVD